MTPKAGMSLNAKLGIGVAALIALVFGVTILSNLSTPPKAKDGDTPDAEIPKEGLRVEPGLNSMRYDPAGLRAAHRDYQQFYETGEHLVSFWVSNPNPVPVRVTFTRTSCGACSFADLAVVSGPAVSGDADPDPFAAVVGGIVGRTPLGKDDPSPFGLDHTAHLARKRIEAALPPTAWRRLKAANSTRPDVTGDPHFEVPAAPNPDQPTWVVVRLNVKVTEIKTLEATFSCKREDAILPTTITLSAYVVPVEPCTVFPGSFDFKQVAEDAAPIEQDVYFWSSCRTVGGPADSPTLPPPDVAAVRDPFVTFGPPVPATAEEVADLARVLSAESKIPVRVIGAYRTTLTFRRKGVVSGKAVEADIGPFDRAVGLVPDGGGITITKTPTVKVKAVILGPVALESGDKIDLQSYPVSGGVDREITLVSTKPGMELEVVPELCEPKHLKIDPELKSETKGTRTRWTLRLVIPPKVGVGELKAGSAVVLRIKGTGQLVRIPVVGRGITS